MLSSKKSNHSINSKCVCGKGLIWDNSPKTMVEPCEHIIHDKCLDKDKGTCPICKTKLTGNSTLAKLGEKIKDKKNTAKEYQKYVDIVSVTNFDNMYKPKTKNLFNMIDVLGISASFPFLSGYDDGQHICKEFLSLMNSKLIVNGLKNVDMTKPRVFIANHTSYLDFIVIFYLLKCGFLASTIINDTWFGRQALDIIPLLTIERGKDTNTVIKMKEYVERTGSICIFPEGMISHPDTLIQFRTGAFYIGYPIYPVIINYDPVVYDSDMVKHVEKIISNPNITITINILPEERPPFNATKIENIRKKMARAGNLALSRVSNRDILD